MFTLSQAERIILKAFCQDPENEDNFEYEFEYWREIEHLIGLGLLDLTKFGADMITPMGWGTYEGILAADLPKYPHGYAQNHASGGGRAP